MVSKNFRLNKLAVVIKGVLIILVFFFLISFVAAIYESCSLEFGIDTDSLGYFITLFDLPIKSGAAIIAVFAIWLTFERMKQTEKQIEEMSKNNKFNNFFKHRDEFQKEFTNNSFFSEVKEITGNDISTQVKLLYNLFYYKSPNKFIPNVNRDKKVLMEQFIEKLKVSGLDQENLKLSEYDYEIIKNLLDEKLFILRNLTNSMHCSLVKFIAQIENENDVQIKTYWSRFVYLNEIFWTGKLYQSILQYDGSPEIVFNNFEISFMNYKELVFYDELKSKVIQSNKVSHFQS